MDGGADGDDGELDGGDGGDIFAGSRLYFGGSTAGVGSMNSPIISGSASSSDISIIARITGFIIGSSIFSKSS